MTLKTQHESLNGVYADIELRKDISTDNTRVFAFTMTESKRTGTVTHDAVKSRVDMCYTDGTAVEGKDAVALSDALLAWLADNGYLGE